MERYTREIKVVTGSGTSNLIIKPSPDHRIHNLQCQLTYAGGVNTLAALMTAMTEIRYLVGTDVKSRLNGTQLRDFMLLHGTGYDFNGLPNTGAQVTIPFAPEWFLDNVADSLAWDPSRLGGAISVEIDSTTALTCKAFETVSKDLGAPSSGILTFELIKPVAGGQEFYVEEPLDLRGRLVSASIYPDSTNSNEITPATLYLGKDDFEAHGGLTSAQNDEQLERCGLTPAAAGRSANIYDIVSVKADMLSRAWDLRAWGRARIKVGAGAAMAGTCSILVTRLE